MSIKTFMFRRGTAAEWADVDPVLADGEPGSGLTVSEINVLIDARLTFFGLIGGL